MRKFTTIKLPNSPSSVRRLPRLGKIRLGIVQVSQRTKKEYPKEVDYFVCPPEVQKIYGPQPREIDAMFPVEQEELIFPQFLGAYGGNHKLLCHGDGENAERWDKDSKEWIKRECPCPWLDEGKCDRRSNLMVVLPKVNLGGVYQIDSGSFNTIVNLNSYFEYLRFLVGRISWVPIKLIREAQQTLDPDGKQQTHYPIKVVFEGTVDAVNAIRNNTDRIVSQVQTYALPEPILEGPLPDTPKEEIKDLEDQRSPFPVEEPRQPSDDPVQGLLDKIKVMDKEQLGPILTEMNKVFRKDKVAEGDQGKITCAFNLRKRALFEASGPALRKIPHET